MWSVESIACILRRNACRGGCKIRKSRTFSLRMVCRAREVHVVVYNPGRPGTSEQRFGRLSR